MLKLNGSNHEIFNNTNIDINSETGNNMNNSERRINDMVRNIWIDGIMGLTIGDALGVPVQFKSRRDIKKRAQGPVTGMEEHGTYDMPIGTWSDDTSMALATMGSLIEKGTLDAGDIMLQFVKWDQDGMYTPFGRAFDQGITCSDSIYNYMQTKDVNTCGRTGEYANGNGALMRILPVCLYYYDRQKKVCTSEDEAIYGIHKVSALTHNHLRSMMCCGFYYFMVKSIIDGIAAYENSKGAEDKLQSGGDTPSLRKPAICDLLQCGINRAVEYYKSDLRNLNEMKHLGRLFQLSDMSQLKEESIKSSGYVVDSLEAAVWSLVTTNSFSECLLKAVNLGDDTDTVAAIAGGLAGLYYGYEGMPAEWLLVIRRREWIEELCMKMNNVD